MIHQKIRTKMLLGITVGFVDGYADGSEEIREVEGFEDGSILGREDGFMMDGYEEENSDEFNAQ